MNLIHDEIQNKKYEKNKITKFRLICSGISQGERVNRLPEFLDSRALKI